VLRDDCPFLYIHNLVSMPFQLMNFKDFSAIVTVFAAFVGMGLGIYGAEYREPSVADAAKA
jgi:hypothetical protein